MTTIDYENPSVVRTIVKHEGISQAEAEARFRGALEFLEVAAKSDTPVSPSPAIDTAWHAFILHTKDYAEYCSVRLGHFVHHQPTGQADPVKLEDARRLAEERFGALDKGIWNVSQAAECGNTCDALE